MKEMEEKKVWVWEVGMIVRGGAGNYIKGRKGEFQWRRFVILVCANTSEQGNLIQHKINQ